MFRRPASLLVLVLATAGHSFSEGIVYLRIHRPILEERIKLSPDKPAERLRTVRNLFEKAGCQPEQIVEQPVPGEQIPNLMCILPGKGEGIIVVGARSDYTERGERGVVQWAGLVMLPLLAESLNSVVHRHTLVLVAFSGHHGAKGASSYLRQLSEAQRKSIRAMVDLDSIGRSPAQYSLGINDPPLLGDILMGAAQALHLSYIPLDVTPIVLLLRLNRGFVSPSDLQEVDSKPFGAEHILTATVYSPASVTVPGLTHEGGHPVTEWHPNLDFQTFEDIYQLLCVSLLSMDRELDKRHAKPGTQVAAAAPATGSGLAAGAAPTPAPNTPSAPVASAPPPSASPSLEKSSDKARTADTTATVSAPASETTPTFHATTRLVQVDVTVTDGKGRPTPGLNASDFVLTENGKPVSIQAFEAHAASTVAPTAAAQASTPATSLPPNTYTNRTPLATDETTNILLFDLLNTTETDQSYARKQMIQFLRNLPPARRIALFVLTSRLDMVQGFTSKSDLLVRAAEALLTNRPALLTTGAEVRQEKADVDFLSALAFGSRPAGGSGSFDPSADYAARMKQAIVDMAAFRNDQRVGFTLQAFDGMARAVAGYPGRKNLIWLSGSFPIALRRDETVRDPGRNVSSYDEAIRRTTSLLATARIAVYPVDVRGLQTNGIDITASTTETNGLANTSGGYGGTLASQSQERYDENTSMKDVAFQTGGEAFIGTNDVKQAINRGISDGSAYYTLAYTPPEGEKEIEFRRIDVKLQGKNGKLAYRRGYYWTPTPKEPVKESGVHALALAMQPGMPPSTMLLLTGQVLPPDASHKGVKIDFRIEVGGIQFTESVDHRKQAVVDCMAVAFGAQGNDVAHAANTLAITLGGADYEAALRDGLPVHEELTLPAGVYTVRVGVLDRASQRVGTVDAQITVPEGEHAALK